MRRLLMAALLSLTLAACGGTESPRTAAPENQGQKESPSTTQKEAPSAPDDKGVMEVKVVDFKYSPAELTVPVGTTVRFVNEDAVRHTVTAGTPEKPLPEEFDLEHPAGETVEVTFDKKGTFEYFCRPHEFMTGTVTVE